MSEAVEASRCQFFENWLMKHKCPHLLKPLGTINQKKYWSFYPSEPFSFDQFTLIHPVIVFSKLEIKGRTFKMKIALEISLHFVF